MLTCSCAFIERRPGWQTLTWWATFWPPAAVGVLIPAASVGATRHNTNKSPHHLLPETKTGKQSLTPCVSPPFRGMSSNYFACFLDCQQLSLLSMSFPADGLLPRGRRLPLNQQHSLPPTLIYPDQPFNRCIDPFQITYSPRRRLVRNTSDGSGRSLVGRTPEGSTDVQFVKLPGSYPASERVICSRSINSDFMRFYTRDTVHLYIGHESIRAIGYLGCCNAVSTQHAWRKKRLFGVRLHAGTVM